MSNPNEIDLSPGSFNAKVLDALTSIERKHDELAKENAELKAKLQREVIAHHSDQAACADMRAVLAKAEVAVRNVAEYFAIQDSGVEQKDIGQRCEEMEKSVIEALAALDNKEPK